MRLSELKSAGRTPSLPLTLDLADAAGPGQLQLLSLLRVLPGERYVGAAVWRGRPVLAKLLVGGKAARHFQRELAGVRLLAQQGLTTPLLLADGLQEGEGGWLLFEFIEGAESLADAWHAVEGLPPLADEQTAVLAEALGAIAQMHAKGLWQEDLHLDNLLRKDGKLYLIDGAGIRVEEAGKPLSRNRVLENLGVFFAQLPKKLEPFTEELLVYYLLGNGEHALPLQALEKQVRKVSAWRLKDFLNKVGRECTLFSVERGAFGLRAMRREEEPAMRPVLEQADALLDQGHLYKTGGGCKRGQGRSGRSPAGDQALQHQGFCPLAQTLLAPEPRLAFLARRQPPGIPRHRYAKATGGVGKALFMAAQPCLPDHRILARPGHHRALRALHRAR